MDELKIVASQITNIVNRIDSKLLDEQTLTNLAAGLSNLREISAKASDTIAGVERLISTNTPPIQNAVSNVVEFSEQLKATGDDMQRLIATNRVVVDESLDNIRQTTESLRNLAIAAEQGKGLAGKLFSDEELARNFAVLSSNLVETSSQAQQKRSLGYPLERQREKTGRRHSKETQAAGGPNRR